MRLRGGLRLAAVTALVSCEKWFDGSFWSATVPGHWRFRQDRSIRGFPYVFESPSDSRMQVGTSKDVELHGPSYDVTDIPDELRSEGHRKAYRMALQSARFDPGWSWRDFPAALFRLARGRAITKRDVGGLVGFTYETRRDDRRSWAGFFSHQRWMLYVYFAGAERAFEADSETALLILASFRFSDS
jgi:hypothetical protein